MWVIIRGLTNVNNILDHIATTNSVWLVRLLLFSHRHLHTVNIPLWEKSCINPCRSMESVWNLLSKHMHTCTSRFPQGSTKLFSLLNHAVKYFMHNYPHYSLPDLYNHTKNNMSGFYLGQKFWGGNGRKNRVALVAQGGALLREAQKA